MKALDLTDKHFGRLHVLSIARKDENGLHWLCNCTCGKQIVLRGSSIARGLTQSCGCYKAEQMSKRTKGKIPATRLAYGEAAKRALYRSYKADALDRNMVFELTLEQFTLLTSTSCFYCGVVPTNSYLPGNRLHYGAYIYNGIDRKDNTIGYVFNNCVACCKICNYAKKTMSAQEYIDHCKAIAERH